MSDTACARAFEASAVQNASKEHDACEGTEQLRPPPASAQKLFVWHVDWELRAPFVSYSDWAHRPRAKPVASSLPATPEVAGTAAAGSMAGSGSADNSHAVKRKRHVGVVDRSTDAAVRSEANRLVRYEGDEAIALVKAAVECRQCHPLLWHFFDLNKDFGYHPCANLDCCSIDHEADSDSDFETRD